MDNAIQASCNWPQNTNMQLRSSPPGNKGNSLLDTFKIEDRRLQVGTILEGNGLCFLNWMTGKWRTAFTQKPHIYMTYRRE